MEQPQDEVALLRELIRRLFGDLLGLVKMQVPQILPGGLPTTFPFMPPLPSPHHLIGSLVREVQYHTLLRPSQICDILFDTPLNQDALFDFYVTQLPEWHAHKKPVDESGHYFGTPMPTEQSIFETPMQTKPYIFTFTQRIPFEQAEYTMSIIFILIEVDPSGMNKVHLKITPAQPAKRPTLSRSPDLPILRLPEGGAMIFLKNSDWNFKRIENSTCIYIDMDLASIAAHFEEQFIAEGWEQAKRVISPEMVWSTWHFNVDEHESWALTFTASQDPDWPMLYLLHLDGRNRMVEIEELEE